jgi:hypothetical protein
MKVLGRSQIIDLQIINWVGNSHYKYASGPLRFHLVIRPQTPHESYPIQSTTLRPCPLCTGKFMSSEDLDVHIWNDHPVCSHCKGRFADQDDLYTHIRRVHSECNQCGKQFRNRAHLEQHMSERLPCHTCSIKRFCSQARLDDHRQTNHKECHDCGIWLLDTETWITHEEENHPTCLDGCQTRFKTYDSYYNHGIWCRTCPTAVFVCNRAALEAHRGAANHAKCVYCKKWFKDHDEYGKHKDKAHPKCRACLKRFKTDYLLWAHMSSHGH